MEPVVVGYGPCGVTVIVLPETQYEYFAESSVVKVLAEVT
jgi:hypothetical protein